MDYDVSLQQLAGEDTVVAWQLKSEIKVPVVTWWFRY